MIQYNLNECLYLMAVVANVIVIKTLQKNAQLMCLDGLKEPCSVSKSLYIADVRSNLFAKNENKLFLKL